MGGDSTCTRSNERRLITASCFSCAQRVVVMLQAIARGREVREDAHMDVFLPATSVQSQSPGRVLASRYCGALRAAVSVYAIWVGVLVRPDMQPGWVISGSGDA